MRRKQLPRVAVELELEERRCRVGFAGVTLVPAEGSDLVAARVRNDEAGEHLRRERPVEADEVDERTAGRFGQVVARDEASEEDDLPDELG